MLKLTARQVVSWPELLLPNCIVVCLDGLDEVTREAWPSVVSEIEELASDFYNVKVVVTSRPHAVPEHWKASLVQIVPLSREEVIAYFEHPARLNRLVPDVQDFLKSRQDILDILQDPLMAEAACRYWHQFEPPGTERDLDSDVQQDAMLEGPLLHHLYRHFFTHHLHRAFRRQLMDYERARQVNAIAKLALEMDGNPSANLELITNALTRFERNSAAAHNLLEVFVDIGLLKPQDGELAFRNETVKIYFAAVGLHSLIKKNQNLGDVTSVIYQANEFWHHCIKLLKEIPPFPDVSALETYLASLIGV